MPVGMNKLQDRFIKAELDSKNASQTDRLETNGIIVKAYDPEDLLEQGLPKRVREKMENWPGLVWAEVFHGPSRQSYLLSSELRAEDIFATGNASVLEGKHVKIRFSGTFIQHGVWVLDRDAENKNLSLDLISTTFDIGALV